MEEYIEFKAPEIGLNRAKKVVPTNRVIRKVLAVQLSQAKTTSVTDTPETVEEMENYTNAVIKLLDDTEDFLTATLGLNKKQQEALEDLTQEQLGSLSGRLQALLMHVDDSAPDTDQEDEPDPK
ncbi:phage tail tube assembly chaperone [Levilactobacillus brevis]